MDLLVRRRLAQVETAELDLAERRGELIRRELVQSHVMSLIDACFRRLLSDVPMSLAVRVAGAARSNTPNEQIATTIYDAISEQLIRCRDEAARRLRGPNETK